MEVIICRNCGDNLGRLIPLYDFLWEKIKKEAIVKTKQEDTAVELLGDLDITAGKLMDSLHITLECCRAEMLSKIKVSKLR